MTENNTPKTDAAPGKKLFEMTHTFSAYEGFSIGENITGIYNAYKGMVMDVIQMIEAEKEKRPGKKEKPIGEIWVEEEEKKKKAAEESWEREAAEERGPTIGRRISKEVAEELRRGLGHKTS